MTDRHRGPVLGGSLHDCPKVGHCHSLPHHAVPRPDHEERRVTQCLVTGRRSGRGCPACHHRKDRPRRQHASTDELHVFWGSDKVYRIKGQPPTRDGRHCPWLRSSRPGPTVPAPIPRQRSETPWAATPWNPPRLWETRSTVAGATSSTGLGLPPAGPTRQPELEPSPAAASGAPVRRPMNCLCGVVRRQGWGCGRPSQRSCESCWPITKLTPSPSMGHPVEGIRGRHGARLVGNDHESYKRRHMCQNHERPMLSAFVKLVSGGYVGF